MNIPQKISRKPGAARLETLLRRGFEKMSLTIKINGTGPRASKASHFGKFREVKASN
ncbi:hypothetical protein ACQZ44_03605 [Agrobacterium vitis]